MTIPDGEEEVEAVAPAVPTPRDRRSRTDDFRMARIGAMAVLVLLVFVLGVQDALSVDYELQPVTLITLLVAIFGLAGLEARDLLSGGDR